MSPTTKESARARLARRAMKSVVIGEQAWIIFVKRQILGEKLRKEREIVKEESVAGIQSAAWILH
jgi:hypothetical protein